MKILSVPITILNKSSSTLCLIKNVLFPWRWRFAQRESLSVTWHNKSRFRGDIVRLPVNLDFSWYLRISPFSRSLLQFLGIAPKMCFRVSKVWPRKSADILRRASNRFNEKIISWSFSIEVHSSREHQNKFREQIVTASSLFCACSRFQWVNQTN